MFYRGQIGAMNPLSRWWKGIPSTSESLTAVINAQSARIEEISSKLRLIEGEWNDVFEKFGRLAGRMERARGWDEKKVAQAEAEAAPPPVPSSLALVPGDEPAPQGTRHELSSRLWSQGGGNGSS